jgi:hypothetical protein
MPGRQKEIDYGHKEYSCDFGERRNWQRVLAMPDSNDGLTQQVKSSFDLNFFNFTQHLKETAFHPEPCGRGW